MERAVVRNHPELIAAARMDPQSCWELVEQNRGLIVRIASQRREAAELVGLTWGELIDAGIDAIMRRTRSYDRNLSDSYAHFIAMCIHQEMSRRIRDRLVYLRRNLSLSQPVRRESGDTHELGELLGYRQDWEAIDEAISPQAGWEEVEPLLDLLEPLERRVVHLYYWENQTFRAIASAIDGSHEWARKLLGRAIRKIRCALKERGLWPAE